MKKMIAICGLICSDCPAFIATMNNDNEELIKVAEKWSSKDFHLNQKKLFVMIALQLIRGL
jgi:hypothetical protein